jgi:predicted amidophosphoribosyltransferase
VRAVVCCDFCGRDTPNKSRICRLCTQGTRNHTKPPDWEDGDMQTLREVFKLDGYDRYTEMADDIHQALKEAIG